MAKKKTPIIEQLEELGSLQFTRREVALVLGIRRIAVGVHLDAYLRGQLKAEAEVRRSVLHHAKAGSAPAQKSFMDLVAQREKLDRGGVGHGQ